VDPPEQRVTASDTRRPHRRAPGRPGPL